MSWFLELGEKLALFGKITLSFLCPGNGGGVAHIFIFGDELVALMPVLFGEITLSFLCPGDRGGVAADSDAEFA